MQEGNLRFPYTMQVDSKTTGDVPFQKASFRLFITCCLAPCCTNHAWYRWLIPNWDSSEQLCWSLPRQASCPASWNWYPLHGPVAKLSTSYRSELSTDFSSRSALTLFPHPTNRARVRGNRYFFPENSNLSELFSSHST